MEPLLILCIAWLSAYAIKQWGEGDEDSGV